MDEKLERLEAIVDRIKADQPIESEEIKAIAKDLETGKKYACASCQMFCAGEEVMVIYDSDNEEFIQIEVPMAEDEPVTVTRAS